jgi:hypothetical protein
VLVAGLAGFGGLIFIAGKGTIGGATMNLGFGLYGALMVVCAALAFYHGRYGRLEQHRAWAIRLFALTVGAWLYRMEYAFWFLAVGHAGHTPAFGGPFDVVMEFFFYLPNLAVAELFIRSRALPGAPAVKLAATGVLLGASAFVALATWFFTVKFWGPGMVSGLTGAPL